ncbi:uncharacterized protein LOC132708013 [Cylas formicarius]|uniref:uncharacterized protein LOC132708013 n=1 Tax=Cylas formicarius TaxID=197179 RepID=UPI0029585458|nr:uncharacterized protein LOC132708013 [Cylas formicarius]
MTNVNKQFLNEFIEVNKSLPCLWKIKSKEYSDINKKSAAYDVLVEKLKEVDTGANRERIKKSIEKQIKWGPYRRYLYSKPVSPLNVLSPEVHNPGVFNIELTEDSEILSRPTSSVSFTPTTSKKKKSPEDSTGILISRACTQLEKKEDQFDTIGKNIASKLRNLPHEQRIYAEKIINDVLFEAELGCLNRNYKLVQEPAATNSNCMEASRQLMPIQSTQELTFCATTTTRFDLQLYVINII